MKALDDPSLHRVMTECEYCSISIKEFQAALETDAAKTEWNVLIRPETDVARAHDRLRNEWISRGRDRSDGPTESSLFHHDACEFA